MLFLRSFAKIEKIFNEDTEIDAKVSCNAAEISRDPGGIFMKTVWNISAIVTQNAHFILEICR